MAAGMMLPFRQLPLLIPSTCWNVTQRNLTKQRTILKKMGYPEKPKRPPTGYFAFVSDRRADVVAQNPKLSFTEVSQVLNKEWKELPKSEKDKYNEEFKRKMAAYKLQMEEYNNSLTEKQKEEMKEVLAGFTASEKERHIALEIRKRETQMNKPKRPVSPYVMFCMKNSDLAFKPGSNLLKVLSEKWKNISESEKQKYKAMYDKENEKYMKDLEKWEEQMMKQGNVDLIRLKTLKTKLQKS